MDPKLTNRHSSNMFIVRCSCNDQITIWDSCQNQKYEKEIDDHLKTKVAAVAFNKYCGVGIAYNASIGGEHF